jgi:hypothetical protein
MKLDYSMNKWNIPNELETAVLERDQNCVYCGIVFNIMNPERRNQPSWEHIINDARIISPENIARCCIGCNASKGAKPLLEWLNSSYCKRMNISAKTVAPVVQIAIETARSNQLK